SAQKDDGGFFLARARERQAHIDGSLRPRWLECGDRFELLDGVARAPARQIEIRQFFAGRNESRVERDRSPQFGEGVIAVPTIAKRQSQEVVRLGKAIVEARGPSQRINR